MASPPMKILGGRDDPTFYTTSWNNLHATQETAVSLALTSESDDEGPPSRPTPATDVPLAFPELFNHLPLRKSNRQTAQEELRHIYAFDLDEPLINTAEHVHFYLFQIDYDS